MRVQRRSRLHHLLLHMTLTLSSSRWFISAAGWFITTVNSCDWLLLWATARGGPYHHGPRGEGAEAGCFDSLRFIQPADAVPGDFFWGGGNKKLRWHTSLGFPLAHRLQSLQICACGCFKSVLHHSSISRQRASEQLPPHPVPAHGTAWLIIWGLISGWAMRVEKKGSHF